MKEQGLKTILQRTGLFFGLDEALLERLPYQPGVSVEAFASGAPLLFPGASPGRLGVILSGNARVYKLAGENRLMMSVLAQGDLLGASTMFLNGAQAVTEVIACTGGCEALFIEENAFRRMLREDGVLLERYLSYLTERIHFLTGRIESIACPTAEDKLMNYLTQNAHGGSVTVPFGMNQLAAALSVSRASLYRVFESLERSGRISRNGKTIKIL